MATALSGNGFRFGWCSVAYGPKGTTLIEPTDRVAAPGEIVRVDLVGFYRGYFSDMSRVCAFARMPSDDSKRAHAAILETNRRLRAETGPGAKASALSRLAHETLQAQGFAMLAAQAGHGIGRDVHEPPYLAPPPSWEGGGALWDGGGALCASLARALWLGGGGGET